MPNRLAHETSPYLLQHQNNPVDWYAWGEEAIEKARREEKPIFLSIGYSACHWCHVMEHESFENAEIAALLNESFVSIKVDREERPDLDQIYMNAVQMLTGRGGWPMSVFLTPELKPFYGGTYWPPHSSRGMPGFDQILAAVVDAWKNRRDQALTAADQITAELQKVGSIGDAADGDLSRELIEGAVSQLSRAFDRTYGGFGQAPKFPHPMDLRLLLATSGSAHDSGQVDMVRLTLDRMAAGGIYDHLGGGFYRYSTDARWLIPHFEKMLYDNALLARAYLDAYLVTGEANYARVVRETLDYVLRDMTDPAGGFYSTEDADSEGHEGLFYTWTPDEIEAVLGEERGSTFGRIFDVTDSGNFEGRNNLNLPKTLEQCASLLKRTPADLAAELAQSKAELLAARDKRVRPGRDDKVIVAWNGLMIDTMARAGAALGEANYIIAADAAGEFHPYRICVARMVASFILGEMEQRSSTPIWTTTRRWQMLLSHSTKRPATKNGSTRQCASWTSCWPNSPILRAAASSTPRTTMSNCLREPRSSPTAAHPAATRSPRQRCYASASCSAAPTISMLPKPRSKLPRQSWSEPRWPPARCSSPSISTWAQPTNWRSLATPQTQKCKPLSLRFGVATYRAQFSPLGYRKQATIPTAHPISTSSSPASLLPTASPCFTSARTSPARSRQSVWRRSLRSSMRSRKGIDQTPPGCA